jgi:hypothetical protein
VIEDVSEDVHVSVTAVASRVLMKRQIQMMADAATAVTAKSLRMVIMIKKNQATILIAINEEDVGRLGIS